MYAGIQMSQNFSKGALALDLRPTFNFRVPKLFKFFGINFSTFPG